MPVGPSPTDLQRKGSLPQCSPRSRSLDTTHGADAAATTFVHRFKWHRRKQSASGAPPASATPPQVESLPPRSTTLPSERSRLQEMIYAVALSESIYRLVDDGPVAAVTHANHILSGVPSADVPPINVQCSLSSVPHRYLVAESKEVIMISFVGTKQIQDLLTDINYWQVPLTTADGAPWPSADNTDEKRSNNVLVHQGFMARSQHIPIKQLYEHARASGKRLLLCGHSLGGAVATLCTLRLLGMDPEAASHIHCITFACVAIGNPEVMRMVHANGWSHLFQNFILPEDDVVRLALLMQLKGLPSVTREVAAHALAMPGLSADADETPNQTSPAEHPNHQLLQSSLAFLNRFTIEDLTTLPFAAAAPTGIERGEPDSQSQPLSASEHSSPYIHMPAAEPQQQAHGAALAASIRPSGGGSRSWNLPFQTRRRSSPIMGGRARSSSPQSVALTGRDPSSPTYSQQPRRGRSPARGRKFTSHAVAGGMGSDHISAEIWKRTGDSALLPAYTQPQHAGLRSASAPPGDTGGDSYSQADLERLTSVRSAISDSDGMAVAPGGSTSGAGERPRRRAAVAALAAARNRAGAKLAGLWSAAQSGAVRFNEQYNVIPSYHPFGLQLYLNPEGVSVGLHSDDVDAVSPSSSSGSAHTAQSPPPRHAAAERVSGDDLPGTVGDDLEHEVSDLVDRGALLPQPLQAGGGRGKVFHMHRMFNYRNRLLHLLAIMDVLPGPYVAPPVRERGNAGADAVVGESGQEEGEEQLDTGVVRLAEEIIPEPQPAHVEVQVHPVRFEVRAGRGSRGAAARPVLARYCDADVCVQGSGLGFVSRATVQVAGAQVEADAAAAAASATQQCMRVKLPLAVVQDASMRPGGHAAISLRSDFAESHAEAHVRVPQCVVVGSADETVCGVMHAVATAAPADMHVDGAAPESRGDAAPRSWAQALRPMSILQRLPWRSRPRSLDRAGEAAPLEPAPVAVCGGVRYVDACWDFAMHRLSDAASARSLFELAAVLQQQTWREQQAARRRAAAAGPDAGVSRALGALVSHFTTRVSHMRVAVAHKLCMVRRGAWAAIMNVSALWRMQLSNSQARMRMLAAQPALAPPRAVEASDVSESLDPDARVAATLGGEPTEGSRASSANSSAEESRRPNVRRPRMRVPRALGKRSGRWFSERAAAAGQGGRSDGEVEPEDESGTLVTDFLYSPAAGTRASVQACVDAVVVAEDVQLWRGQRPPVVMRRRRRAVGRVVEAAVARGATVVLVLSVPTAADEGQAFEWLEEVTQMRSAYGLQSVEHRVVVLDAAGESGAACSRLHNAVVNSLAGREADDDDDALQMNSKL